MHISVLKFGGTSVGDADKIKRVAKRIQMHLDQNKSVVVVVSAMGQTTDLLLQTAEEVSPHARVYLRDLDKILATGEQVSAPLLAMALKDRGVDALSLTGAQAGITTDGRYGQAKIEEIDTRRILNDLSQGKVLVVTGFQGFHPTSGDETTLGRGGSDTTAVALAAALSHTIQSPIECVIYTDVDGILTADPRVVSSPRVLKETTYEDAMDAGQVIAPRAVELAMRYNQIVVVRSTFGSHPGTTIGGIHMEGAIVTGVSKDSSWAWIRIEDVTISMVLDIFEALGSAEISMGLDMYDAGSRVLNITVPRQDGMRASGLVSPFGRNCRLRSDVAKVTLRGIGLTGAHEITYAMLSSLQEKVIDVLILDSPDNTISVLVYEDRADDAVRVLHRAFQNLMPPQ